MKDWCVPLIALPLMLAGCQSTGSIGGTNWTVAEFMSSSRETTIVGMDINFGTNGVVTTTTTHAAGAQEETQRRYAVHEALISVRRPDGDMNVLHRVEGDEMFLTAENFQARLVRLD